MEGLNFSKKKKRKPLSHYKILHSRHNDKGAFNDSNHLETIKPGTLLGFMVRDKNGVTYPNLDSYLQSREQKQEKVKQDEIEKDEELTL